MLAGTFIETTISARTGSIFQYFKKTWSLIGVNG